MIIKKLLTITRKSSEWDSSSTYKKKLSNKLVKRARETERLKMGWKSHKLYYETSKWNILWLTSTKLELYVSYKHKIYVYVRMYNMSMKRNMFILFHFIFFSFLPPYSLSFPFSLDIYSSELSVINYFVLFHSIPSFLLFFYCTLFIIVITMIYVAVLPLASPHTSDCSRSALILFFYMLSCSFHLVLNFFFFSLLQFRLNFWKNWITAVMLDIFLLAFLLISNILYFCGCSFNIVIVICE